MVASVFNPSMQEAKAGRTLCLRPTSSTEHIASSKTAMATLRNPVWEKRKRKIDILTFILS